MIWDRARGGGLLVGTRVVANKVQGYKLGLLATAMQMGGHRNGLTTGG